MRSFVLLVGLWFGLVVSPPVAASGKPKTAEAAKKTTSASKKKTSPTSRAKSKKKTTSSAKVTARSTKGSSSKTSAKKRSSALAKKSGGSTTALAQQSPASTAKETPAPSPEKEAGSAVPASNPAEEAGALLAEESEVLDPLGEGSAEDIAFLVGRDLLLPVEGILPKQLRDTFYAGRSGGRHHRASDIMAPKLTPVVATTDGTIARLENNKKGGISIYQRDDAGPYVYYYAHLDHYASGLSEGQSVTRGQVIGYVGNTGNARGRLPHLHFGIYRSDNPKRWWTGLAINPYALFTGKGLPGSPSSAPASQPVAP
jgi:murein DD-endopeptidase MepM/ murein hydrolase activator NlpD